MRIHSCGHTGSASSASIDTGLTTGAQGRSEASEWQEKWQQAVKELADVKERAWSLLEEKDLQLQALKVRHYISLSCPHLPH